MSKRRWRRWARWGPCWICRIGSLSTESPSPEGDGFGRHKHARPAEAGFRSRPDRRLSAAALRRFRSLRDLLKASPKGEGFHPSPRGTLTGVTIEPLRKTRGGSHPCRQLCENRIENLIEPSKAMRIRQHLIGTLNEWSFRQFIGTSVNESLKGLLGGLKMKLKPQDSVAVDKGLVLTGLTACQMKSPLGQVEGFPMPMKYLDLRRNESPQCMTRRLFRKLDGKPADLWLGISCKSWSPERLR